MGWNDNIKRILDFIPVFERDSKKMGELVQQLTASQEACQAAIKKSEFLEWQNKTIIEKLERLESAPVEVQKVEQYDDSELKEAFAQVVERLQSIKPYDDSGLKKEIARFNELFDSFRRTEGEQAATAISNIAKKVREIGRAVDAIKPYDDTALIEKVESIKPFDDAKLKESIKKIADDLLKIKPYNDSQIKEELSSISQFIDDLEPFNDSQLKEAINEIAGRVKSIDRYDDSKLVEMIEAIKPYNDAQVKKSIKLLGDKVKAIKPYSDTGIKNQLNDLTKKTVKMINDHKSASDRHSKEALKGVEQRIDHLVNAISKLSDSIPEAYEDKQISDRITKQGEIISEVSGDVSRIKQLFEVD